MHERGLEDHEMNISTFIRTKVLETANAQLEAAAKKADAEQQESLLDVYLKNQERQSTSALFSLVSSVSGSAMSRIFSAKSASTKEQAITQLANASADIKWCIGTVSGYANQDSVASSAQAIMSELAHTQSLAASEMKSMPTKLGKPSGLPALSLDVSRKASGR